MKIPVSPWALLSETHFKVLPTVRSYLKDWRLQASQIPDPELRQQALASLDTKQFHCEGGAIYGLLAQRDWRTAIRFIVAYQTISDYLDNLCDRSTSLDPNDFRALHDALLAALSPNAALTNYYRWREEQDDGGYLHRLVRTCQNVLATVPHYTDIAAPLHDLVSYYCDLQVHKHVKLEERLPRLKTWFALHQAKLPDLTWYEFSACAGSTLGVFCLVASAFNQKFSTTLAAQVQASYFPWVQGLHILLDYLIDQEEDRQHGDLNFCFYYPSQAVMTARFQQFSHNAYQSVAQLPHMRFHQLIHQALLSVYLSDKKVKRQPAVQALAKQLLGTGGSPAAFFLQNRLLAAPTI